MPCRAVVAHVPVERGAAVEADLDALAALPHEWRHDRGTVVEQGETEGRPRGRPSPRREFYCFGVSDGAGVGEAGAGAADIGLETAAGAAAGAGGGDCRKRRYPRYMTITAAIAAIKY